MLLRNLMAGGGGVAPPSTASITWNDLDRFVNISLSESGKRLTRINGSQWGAVRGTVGHDAADLGGFYFEAVVMADGGPANGVMMGIATSAATIAAGSFPGADANGRGYYSTAQKFVGGSPTAYGNTFTVGDNIGTFLKNGKVYWRKNGVWQNSANPDAETGAAFTGLTGIWYPMGGAFYTDLSSWRAVDRVYSLPTGATNWIP